MFIWPPACALLHGNHYYPYRKQHPEYNLCEATYEHSEGNIPDGTADGPAGYPGGALGGQGDMWIALVMAGGMNFFSSWFSDKMVLSMYGAQEITSPISPFLRHRPASRHPGRAAHAQGVSDRYRHTQCICHRPQPAACSCGRDDRHPAHPQRGRTGRRHGP